MQSQSWFNLVAASIAVALVCGVLIGVGVDGATGGPQGATGNASLSAVYHVNLTISFNPGTGMDQYYPANFSVPADVLIIFTIDNYDNGTNLVNGSAALVTGTLGSVATTTPPGGAPRTYSSLSDTQIAHTFTVNLADGILNVPIGPSPNLANPNRVSFGAYFNQTGTFIWFCQAPCDMRSMMDPGFMTGAIAVA